MRHLRTMKLCLPPDCYYRLLKYTPVHSSAFGALINQPKQDKQGFWIECSEGDSNLFIEIAKEHCADYVSQLEQAIRSARECIA